MANYDGRGLVSTEWLAEHLDDPSVRVFDATVHLRPATPGPYAIESGREDYAAGHVPGAAFLDLASELSDPDARLPFTKPSLERLAAALGAAGVGPRSLVVAYSTTTPMWATRLWWLLRAAGFEHAAVLDGGLAKWKAEGRPVETGERRYPPAQLTLTARPDAWADKDAVLAAIEDGGVCTINALSPSVHSGESATNYGRKGDYLRVYEINPLIENIAQKWFTFYPHTDAEKAILMGDARLTLERQEPQHFDIMAVDAFSSDAIPVHLLTREAMAVYWKHLKPDGILALHISNRYLNLEPVCMGDALAYGKIAMTVDDDGEEASYMSASTWVLVTENPDFFKASTFADADMHPAKSTPKFRPWTDDYSNLFQILSVK